MIRSRFTKSCINGTHLVELITEVYRIDVVTLQVRKHNDLLFYTRQKTNQSL